MSSFPSRPSPDDERQFTELRMAPIAKTIGNLHRRIEARFPGSGLSRVAAELIQLAELNATVMHQLGRPYWWLRGLIAVAVAGVVAIALWASTQLVPLLRSGLGGIADALQGVEAATNEIILLSLAVLFLVSLETRVKRRVALRMLHRLRSIAHVVDMHQLTKDPDSAVQSTPPTDASPERTLTRAQLGRYLDYCSELLALVSKLAAVLAQHQQDPVVLGAVNEIEVLTSSLSRKIWQKITILEIAGTGRD
jgi:type II secretory pathway pseudopilin PulG